MLTRPYFGTFTLLLATFIGQREQVIGGTSIALNDTDNKSMFDTQIN